MSITSESVTDLRQSGDTAKLSAFLGCGWGLVAYLIGYRLMDHTIWGGLLASPLIGVLVGRLAESFSLKSRRVQIAASLLDLYLAGACFGFAMAVFALVVGTRQLTLAGLVTQYVLGVWWGLTFTGYFIVLWPLSFFSHQLVWHAGSRPPRISITDTMLRSVALKMMVLIVVAYFGWAVLQDISSSARSSAASPTFPSGILTGLVGWANWFVFGTLVWLTAPVLASAAVSAARSETPATATYGDLVGLMGFTLFAFPFVFFAATLIVMIIKVSLVHSWPTEGVALFASSYYYNAFRIYLPWLAAGGGNSRCPTANW